MHTVIYCFLFLKYYLNYKRLFTLHLLFLINKYIFAYSKYIINLKDTEMKKSKMSIAFAMILGGSIMFSSCVGSFSLFNKLSSWNQNVSDKYVNEVVFLALHIVPVYEVCYMADALVINSIEFWTGSNPVAKVGDVKKVKGENGDYTVETLKNGYSISKDGKNMKLLFNEESQTWNVVSEGVSKELMKMKKDGTVQLYLPNGGSMNVTLDAKGLVAARQATMNNTYYAAR